MHTYASFRVERKSFYRKSELQMFLLISGGHTGAGPKRYTNMAKNSETVGHKNLRQIVYILVFYNISFSWLLPLDGFQFFFCYVTVKTIYRFFGDKIWEEKCHTYRQSRLLNMEYVYGRVRHSPDRLDLAQQITTNFTKTSVYFKIFIHHIYS